MDIIKNKMKVYLITCGIIALAVTVLHTILLMNYFDGDIGYFNNSLLSSITVAMVFVSILWFFSALLFIPKNILKADMPKTNISSKFGFIMCALLNAFGFFYYAYNLMDTQTVSKIPLISAIFFLLSTFYFVGKAFDTFKKTDTTVLFGFFIIFTSIALLAETYFDKFVQMNSPLKVTIQISLLFIMLYYLSEFRFDLKKPYPRLYFVVALSAFIICMATSIPHIIAYSSNILDNTDYFLKDIYILINGLYIALRTVLYVKHNLSIPSVPEDIDNEIISE